MLWRRLYEEICEMYGERVTSLRDLSEEEMKEVTGLVAEVLERYSGYQICWGAERFFHEDEGKIYLVSRLAVTFEYRGRPLLLIFFDWWSSRFEIPDVKKWCREIADSFEKALEIIRLVGGRPTRVKMCWVI